MIGIILYFFWIYFFLSARGCFNRLPPNFVFLVILPDKLLSHFYIYSIISQTIKLV